MMDTTSVFGTYLILSCLMGSFKNANMKMDTKARAAIIMKNYD